MQQIPDSVQNLLESDVRVAGQRYLDDFIFVHINKTAGTSIEKALNLPHEHKTALEIISEIGITQWSDKFSFTVVRNPWDRVVSQYHYRVLTNQTELGTGKIGFKRWVTLSYGEKDPRYYDRPMMFMPQFDWITDVNGNILIDRVCRFESLESDLQDVCDRINRKLELPHLRRSSHDYYKCYYDDESIDIVRKSFVNDIDEFRYTF